MEPKKDISAEKGSMRQTIVTIALTTFVGLVGTSIKTWGDVNTLKDKQMDTDKQFVSMRQEMKDVVKETNDSLREIRQYIVNKN